MTSISRFGVYQVNLDSTIGSEVAKSCPCVVVSPDEMNQHIHTVIVAPLTTTEKRWPSRVAVHFGGKAGEVALDQIRAVDKRRLAQCLGQVNPDAQASILAILAQMFRL